VGIRVIPCTLKESHAFVRQWHRHHRPSQGGLFAVACASDDQICGVAVVGRPTSRLLQDGYTAEVVRLATDGTKNSASMLYATCWRAARALGYRRLITYILDSESGVSLRASGWKLVAQSGGGSWSRPSRPRVDTQPLQGKLRYEVFDFGEAR
jgi:hypothetical protein